MAKKEPRRRGNGEGIWSETRDKRTLGWGARAPSVGSGPVVAQHCTASCVCCVYCVPRYPSPSTHYCVRCTYATYETTTCVSGLVGSKEPGPGLLTTIPGGKERTGYPGGGSVAVHVERTASKGRVRASHVEADQSPRTICDFACSVRTFFQHGRAEWIRHGHGL